jgi:subtilase family serine protease
MRFSMSTLRFPSLSARAGIAFLTRDRNRFDLICEALETRQLLSATTSAADLSQIKAQPDLRVMPLVSSGPTGLSPQQVTSAYGVNQIKFSGGKITGDGSGQTIAIVTAFHDPNIGADLVAFDSHYKLPNPPSFKVNDLGGSTTDPGWALETALDVEWAHAVAPGARILLVEAASDSLSDLISAVSYASRQPGVSVVSMSWGGNEFWGESSYDSTFTTPSGHSGVTFVAASGDSGAWSGPSYPAVSPNVLAVGGTSLSLSANNAYGSESGWIGSTGGFSGYDSYWWTYESAPSYQTSTLQAVGLYYGTRTTPDVSFNADPNTGVAVYDSVSYSGQSGWFQLGGTSAAAPAWAGLIAITDQGLATGGKGPLSGTQAQAGLYALPSSDFHDVVSGFNGYRATYGYDLVTGLGSPKANLVIAGLLSANGVSIAAASVQVSTSTSHGTSSVTSSRFDVTSSVAAGSGGAVASSSNSGSSAATSTSVAVGALSATGQVAGALQVQALTTQAGLTQAPAQPVAQNASITTPLGRSPSSSAPAQGLSQQSTWRRMVTEDQDQQPDWLVDATEPALPSTPLAPEAPASEPTPAPEPSPVAPPPAPAEPASNPTIDDFDLALAQVSWSLAARRLEFPPAPLHDTDRVQDDRPAWGVSTLAGTAVVAAGGYRLLLGRSDRIRRRWLPGRFS